MAIVTAKAGGHGSLMECLHLVSGSRPKARAFMAAALLALATSRPVWGQTFASLLSFNGADGTEPLYGSLAQGRDGNLWGTTAFGGTNNLGTVFNVSPAGTLTTMYNFGSMLGDGSQPYATPILGTDGNFYGTNFAGTVYRLTPGGVFTVLANVPSSDGSPTSALLQGKDGAFYGVAYAFSGGTVFKVTPSGIVTTLHTFTGPPDGQAPNGGLIQGTDGNFYGTTLWGGVHGTGGESGGTVFKMTPTGTLTTLHSFDGSDGETLSGALVQAKDGNFYGTTEGGGSFGYGTVFKITPAGVLTTLYNFDISHGQVPAGALVQGTDGNLYGTTNAGGDDGLGTIFKITTSGALTVLHSFNGTDGSNPDGGLTQYTSGTFYGFTVGGGPDGDGTIFSLDMGLGPFVETLPTSGKVGAVVGILGSSLTGATSVTFNGTPAIFQVTSNTFIKTSVPNNATTGPVKVVTPGHTYSSNLKFRVTPTILSFSPPSGPVGISVTIVGNSLTGATAVTFGGVRATSFTSSYTQITATVPPGAITGKIGVTTPGGTAVSAEVFTVTQ